MGMALTSPGVEVTVIDESFYTPAEPGTTPLIVVATGQDKVNGAGTGTAQGTLAANVGNVYRVTSQRELVDLFGSPFFEKTASSTPIHGSELNEYGLLSAYSLLGVSNSAFVARANVNLSELAGSAEAPGAAPADGTWWVDTRATTWGIQEWNNADVSTTGGQKFANKTPVVLTDTDTGKVNNGAPVGSVGAIGDYAVVFQTVNGGTSFTASKELATIWYKTGVTVGGNTAGDWVLVGSQQWALAHPVITSNAVSGAIGSTGTIIINGNSVSISSADTLSEIVASINSVVVVDADTTRGVFATTSRNRLYLYTNAANDQAGDSTVSNSIVIEEGTGDASAILTALGITAGNEYYGPVVALSPHTQVPQWKNAGAGQTNRPTGSVWIKTTEPNNGARWRIKQWNESTSAWVEANAPIYATPQSALFNLDRSSGGSLIPLDTLFVQSNAEEHTGFDTDPLTATFRVWKRSAIGNTSITSNVVSDQYTSGVTYAFTISESLLGSEVLSDTLDDEGNFTGTALPTTVSFTASGDVTDAEKLASAINASGLTNVEASVTSDDRVQIIHRRGGDFRLTEGSGTPVGKIFVPFNIDSETGTANFYNLNVGSATDGSGPLMLGVGDTTGILTERTATEDYLASNWRPLAVDDFYASDDDPTEEPADGTLWYNPEFSEVDLMVHNGTTWVGINNYSEYTNAEVIVSASEPVLTDDQKAINNHIWISTADLENFPTMYRWNDELVEWVQIDKTDQVTEEGVLFADARWSTSGGTIGQQYPAGDIDELRLNNYLDPDAPDPALYPRGMLLWNTRRSGGNVKRYVNNYIDLTADNPRFNNNEAMSGYAEDRWITASPNQEDGSGSFGRKAQRAVVVAALKSFTDTNDQIRDEERRNFNLIACPGYPELMSNLVNLNIDRGVTAFVIGDTPLRLPSDATSLSNWGSNANLVTDNGDDGIVTYDEYLATFYPNGITTDLTGTSAVVPASHMMMRTIALSDQVSFPWFAPAGTRRGGITNATAVGYIDSLTGEFQTVALNEGQRDTLYDLKINPIPFFNGVGLVNYGQKTRARNASALDRINVARLVVYLRSQLNKLARPYIFEPNDKITRDEIKQAVESLLLELVGLRAIFDFAVVCDETNNTPARIDRNELYVDVAIEPVKAVEFIYIPLRVKNTGEI